MNLLERYSRNLGAFSANELKVIEKKTVCIVGCGGLGGFVITSLARFGIEKLTLIDGDDFCTSNLNRQLFATEQNIGKNKVLATAEALKHINSKVVVNAHPTHLDDRNALALIQESDLVVDCLDNIASRRILVKACGTVGIPLVHGAVAGLYGQVGCIFPGDNLMDVLYPVEHEEDQISPTGSPIFAPQLVADRKSTRLNSSH